MRLGSCGRGIGCDGPIFLKIDCRQPWAASGRRLFAIVVSIAGAVSRVGCDRGIDCDLPSLVASFRGIDGKLLSPPLGRGEAYDGTLLCLV